ncbi:MAG: flagellar basal-body MS-ring/collar protein FliF [Pseudomonadota bacterium]
MAEAIEGTVLTRFGGYSQQPLARQFALLIGLAASVAIAVGLAQWVMQPTYKPLYGAMTPEDTSAVIASLQAAGIDYDLDRRSGMIAVPAAELQRARLALASEGYPRGDGQGYESLYREQEIGLSSFMEQARFHRALESELSRTIASMDSVRSARVHLAMTKQSAFLREREKPAASVMLSLLPGRRMTDRQLAGIINLVASSVPNLMADQVSVVDQNGKLLSNQGQDSEIGYTQEQFRFSRQIENDYNRRILEILEPILGPEAVRAQVAADVDFTRIERTSESYSPDTTIRSEQTSEETSSQQIRGGVPGSLSTQPPADPAFDTVQPGADGLGADQTEAAQTSPTRSSRRSTVNYEVDKTISHVRETPGSLRKLSIAVVLDYIETTDEEGNVTSGPLPQPRVDEITALVREAVGFDGARGDTVSVISAPFIEAPEVEPELFEASLMDEEWFWPAVKMSAALIVLLTLILTVIRPIVKFSAIPMVDSQAALENGQLALGADGEVTDDQLTLGADGNVPGLPGTVGDGPTYQEQLQSVREMAETQPERAAYVVKGWVADDG